MPFWAGSLPFANSAISVNMSCSQAARWYVKMSPYIKAGREPLSYAGINSIGLRRRGFSNETITELQDIYRIIFQKGYNNSQALEVIRKPRCPHRMGEMKFCLYLH